MIIRKRTTTRLVAGALGILLTLAGLYAWYMGEQGNFHTITPGEAYRSAQLDGDELDEYIRAYGIRSVINLRGARPNKAWYREEMAVSRELGIRHFDYGGIGAVRPPKADELATLLDIFALAPRPVLLHCQAGADRSGLAAAIWKVVIDHAPPAQARRQLSLLYGHMPVGPTQVLDSFFDDWSSTRDQAAAGAPAGIRKES